MAGGRQGSAETGHWGEDNDGLAMGMPDGFWRVLGADYWPRGKFRGAAEFLALTRKFKS